MLNEYDMHKLLDDLKRVSRIIPILRDEKEERLREKLAQLALDELQKLVDDLNEVKNSSEKEGGSNE